MSTFEFTPEFASGFAVFAHEGQPEKSGGDYHDHLARVAGSVPHAYQALAWLHDVVEDTQMTIERLAELGAPSTLTTSISLLSKPPKAERPAGFTYVAWVEEIITSGDIPALQVKAADVADHLRDGYEEVVRPEKVLEYQAADELLRCSIRDRKVDLAADLIARTAYFGHDFEFGVAAIRGGRDREKIDDLTSRALMRQPRDRMAIVAARDTLLRR